MPKTKFVVHVTLWTIHYDEQGEIERTDLEEEEEVKGLEDEYETYDAALTAFNSVKKERT